MNKSGFKNLSRKTQYQREKQDFLKVQNKCYLCGKDLNTYIEYLPKTHLVVERAQCYGCMTLVRVKNHFLQ